MGSSSGKLDYEEMGHSSQSLGSSPPDPGEDVDFVDDEELLGVGLGNRSSSADCWNTYCVDNDTYIDMIKDHIYPTTVEWILIGAHFIAFTVGLVGNFLVCVAVYRNTSMRTVTNYFIVNLAVADFMVILFCLPPTVLWDVTETWFLGDALCKVVLYFQTVSVSVSVLTLTFISVERWYAICFPLKFKATTSRAKRAIIAIWLISLTVDIPELIVLHARPRETLHVDTIYFTQCVPDWDGVADITYCIFRIVLLYFLPLAFMSFAYYQIARVLWSSTNIPGDGSGGGGIRREPTLSNGNTHVQFSTRLLTPIHRGTSISQGNAVDFQLRSRRKAAKMLVAVVTMFAFCYLPVHLYTILSLIMNIPQTDLIGAIVMISHWLPYANSAMNPLIYNFMSEKFQKEFLRTFGCWMFLRRRNRRIPIRRNTTHSYSGYNGARLSTYSRNYPGSTRVETTVVQFATTVLTDK